MPRPSPSNPRPASCIERPRQRGLSLVELVIGIAVIGIAVAGVLLAYRNAVRGSADPLVRKQAIAVAESLLSEVLLQPFTWCDPQDAKNLAVAPPASGADCTGGAAASQDAGGGTLGPRPAGESRASATDPFDNVADYHGFSMGPGIVDSAGNAVPGLEGYSATVTVTRDGGSFGADGFAVPADAVLRIDVQVTGRGESVTLTGWRFRHSPNATG